jgi:hypothetical protein
MSVDFFAQVAQIVAAVGVIVSLIYVGMQIRQATRATKLASIQAVEAAIGRTEELIIQDGGFADILRRGLTTSGADLLDAERIRLNVFYRHTLRAYQSAHYQHLHGALDDSVWTPLAKGFAAIYQADRGLREHFAVEKYMLDQSFVASCEKLFRDADPLTITSGDKPHGDAPASRLA